MRSRRSGTSERPLCNGRCTDRRPGRPTTHAPRPDAPTDTPCPTPGPARCGQLPWASRTDACWRHGPSARSSPLGPPLARVLPCRGAPRGSPRRSAAPAGPRAAPARAVRPP
ncbi:hypothetical protein FM106_20685 [Brachybacterium faecium]|nr:hypothetical protein FM106_20685 [Brachybacterium faecium]